MSFDPRLLAYVESLICILAFDSIFVVILFDCCNPWSSLNHGSFDVIIGMDWLSKRKFVIVCHEKVVRIPLEDDEILRVHGKRTQGVVKTLLNTKVQSGRDRREGVRLIDNRKPFGSLRFGPVVYRFEIVLKELRLEQLKVCDECLLDDGRRLGSWLFLFVQSGYACGDDRLVKSRDAEFPKDGDTVTNQTETVINAMECVITNELRMVENLVGFHAFTFVSKEMILIIREVFVKLLLKSSGKLSIRHGLYETIVCYVLLANVIWIVVLERDRLKALVDLSVTVSLLWIVDSERDRLIVVDRGTRSVPLFVMLSVTVSTWFGVFASAVFYSPKRGRAFSSSFHGHPERDIIKQRIQAARDRQKSYADVRRKPLEFQVGNRVMLKVSPWKGVVRFSKRWKLNPRYIRPFKVLAKVGTVSYKLELPQQLIMVHSMFHVSNLKKCLSDEPLAVLLDEIHIDDKLRFIEELVEIVDREVKRLKQSYIPIIKVQWNSRRGLELTWEREDQFRKKYAHLFTKTAPSTSVAS
ncbi:hypothetical protein Tco_0151981 [Tanacetum coccineum]